MILPNRTIQRRCELNANSARALYRHDIARFSISVEAAFDHNVMLGKNTFYLLSLFEQKLGDARGHSTFLADTAKHIRKVSKGRLLSGRVQRAFSIPVSRTFGSHR